MSQSNDNTNVNNVAGGPPVVTQPSPSASTGVQTPISGVAVRASMFSSSSKPKRRRLDFGTVTQTLSTSYSSGSNENSTNKAWIIKVLPDNPESLKLCFSGYTVTPNVKYADDFCTKILFSGASDKAKKEFLTATNCVPRVIDTSHNGKRVEYVGSDSNIYGWKGLAFVTDDEDIITNENIQNHVNDVVTPSVKEASVNTKNATLFKWMLTDKKFPHLGNMDDTNSVRTVKLWSEAIHTHQSIVFIINHGLSKYAAETGQNAIKFKEWLKLDKNHIYTIFNKGNIPASFIKYNRLDADCMDDSDWSAYLTSQRAA